MVSLKIYIDWKSPASYLALGPTLRLLDELDLQAVWLPLRSAQSPLPAAPEPGDVGASHRWTRAHARQRMHLHYADVQGLDMKFPAQPGSSDLALNALLLANDCSRTLLWNFFRAYWVDGLDLNNAGVVHDLATQSGVELDGDNLVDLGALEVHLTQALEFDKVVDAPGYVVGEEVFIGREHLPWIRECLLHGEQK